MIQRGFIIYRGVRAFIASQATYALPLAAFLVETGGWLHGQSEARALKEIRRRTNLNDASANGRSGSWA